MNVAWVTGARGFIGRHLSLELSRRGELVAGVGHGHWPEREARAWGMKHWLNGGLSEANLDVLRARTGPPAVLYHLAGGSNVGTSISAPLEDFHRTVEGGARTFEWIRTRSPSTRIVVVSSAAVYGAGHDGPIGVNVRPCPFSPYGHHKLMLELLAQSYARQFSVRTMVVRLFSVYGPGLQKQLLWDLCSRLLQGCDSIVLGGNGGELRDWIEISDVTRLLIAAGESNDSELDIINGGTGVGTSVRDIASRVVDAWGVDLPIDFSGKSRSGDPYSLVALPACINQKPFVWTVPLEQGIPRYVEWFRESAS